MQICLFYVQEVNVKNLPSIGYAKYKFFIQKAPNICNIQSNHNENLTWHFIEP